MNKRISVFVSLILLFSLLMGCGKEEVKGTPVEETMNIGENFVLTISSEQDCYSVSGFKNNCSFTMKLKYVGEKEEIQITHGLPLGFIVIENGNGDILLGSYQFNEALCYKTMKKGEVYEVVYNSDDLKTEVALMKQYGKTDGGEKYDLLYKEYFKNKTLKKGTYQAVAVVSFDIEGEDKQPDDIIELPLTFEIR